MESVKSLKKLVYLIDDDPISNFITSKVLNGQSFEKLIRTFENGKIAFQDLLNLSWENLNQDFGEIIIFLDINMPVMNGWEFLNACIENNLDETVPIRLVMLTSSIDSQDFNLSRKYEMVKDFITKPLTPQKLEDAFPDLKISGSNN
jgi:response regulator RpfG family c-di-GMP phosphodiesterase